ncbi:MAG TPA: exosortase/archaeosortase family protein [Candidatus Sulfotelmatobacter sp.]|nr:exosortase/archaeosortase family protein [Candidatus Sulfotelmatobacter sp.]
MERKFFPKLVLNNENDTDLTLKTATVIMLPIVLFFEDFYNIFENAFQNLDASFLLFIPLVFIYLVYRKRKILAVVTQIENHDQPKRIRYILRATGMLTPVIGALLYWHGSLTSTPIVYHFLALPIFIAGLILLFFNYQTLKQLMFPIVFLFFLTPLPFGFLQDFGNAISTQYLGLSLSITNILGVPLSYSIANPSTIMFPRPDGSFNQFTVGFSAAYNVLIFVVLSGLVAYLTRESLLRKISIIMLEIPLIYVLNILRATTLITIHYYFAESLLFQDSNLLSIVNLLQVWIFICAGFILMSLLTRQNLKAQISTINRNFQNTSKITLKYDFSFSSSRIRRSRKKGYHNTIFLKIAAAAFSVIVLLSIQTPVFAVTPSPSVALTHMSTGAQMSADILPTVPNYSMQVIGRDPETEKQLNVDMAALCLYAHEIESQEQLWVSIEVASSRWSLPPWSATLIDLPLRQGKNPDVELIEFKDVQLMSKPIIAGQYIVFRYLKTDQIEAVLYWYESAVFRINSTVQPKYVEFSLIAYPENTQALSSMESKLSSFAEAVVSYWQPIQPWSAVAAVIVGFGLYIAGGLACGLFAAAVMVCSIEYAKRKKGGGVAYSKLSKQNQQFIDIIRELEKKTKPTIDKIGKSCEKTTNQVFTESQLIQKLRAMEKMGILKNMVMNKDDEPELVWRTSIN